MYNKCVILLLKWVTLNATPCTLRSVMFLSLKSCRLRDNVETYGTAGRATDDNMAFAFFTLDT